MPLASTVPPAAAWCFWLWNSAHVSSRACVNFGDRGSFFFLWEFGRNHGRNHGGNVALALTTAQQLRTVPKNARGDTQAEMDAYNDFNQYGEFMENPVAPWFVNGDDENGGPDAFTHFMG